MKIYTRKGDEGTTFIPCHGTVYKDNGHVTAVGLLDELNANLGLMDYPVGSLQTTLLKIGAAVGRNEDLDLSHEIKVLENGIDTLESKLPPLTNFILPKGQAQVARTVCRRVERHFCDFPMRSIKAYLNRLSDFLFVLGRTQNQPDFIWEGQ